MCQDIGKASDKFHKFSLGARIKAPVSAAVAKASDKIIPFKEYGLPSHTDLNNSFGSMTSTRKTGESLLSGKTTFGI